jgi:hypothetical protein
MVHKPINTATTEVVTVPTGVTVRATPAAPRAYCHACKWYNDGGECQKAAIRHAVDSGHVTTVAIIGNVTFTPTPTEPKAG